MRCLVVADLHYSLPQYDWLLGAAPLFDLVVFAGDALDVGSLVDFRAQIVVVQKYFELLAGKTRVVLCSGNHDLDDRSPDGEKIARWIESVRSLGIACDGDSFSIGDIDFTVCPWWDGPVVRARLDQQLRDAAAGKTRRWIWIHHAPPTNSPTSWGGSRSFGDKEVAEWIDTYQPSMVLSGHVHQSPFVRDGSWFDKIRKTWVFNAGHQYGRPPAHIVIDLEAERAFWLSAAGAQYIDLGAELRRPAANITEAPEWLKSLDRVADPILATPSTAAG